MLPAQFWSSFDSYKFNLKPQDVAKELNTPTKLIEKYLKDN